MLRKICGLFVIIACGISSPAMAGTFLQYFTGSPETNTVGSSNSKLMILQDGITKITKAANLPVSTPVKNYVDSADNTKMYSSSRAGFQPINTCINSDTIITSDRIGQLGMGKINGLVGVIDSKLTSPANPAYITQDANYRFVSDTEKGVWNNKITSDYAASLLDGKVNSNSIITSDRIGQLGMGKINGLAEVIDSKLTSPANPAYITQDANYRFVSDTEKGVWNNKITSDYAASLLDGKVNSSTPRVFSFNSRTGAVTPTADDYSWSDITSAPVFTGNAGNFLSTDGNTGIWTSRKISGEWRISGTLSAATEQGGAWIVPQALTIEKAYIYCKTTGSSSSTIVDIHKNGTTIFTTQGNRPTLAYDDGDKKAASGTPDVVSLDEGDIVTLDIDQIAADAADLSVILICH